MQKVEIVARESLLHLWLSFILQVIFITLCITTVIGSVIIIIAACIFESNIWEKLPLVVIVAAIMATSLYVKAHSLLFEHTLWNFRAGITLAFLVILAGKMINPPWSALICYRSPGPVCLPVANAILATIEIAIVGAIIWNTDGHGLKESTPNTAHE